MNKYSDSIFILDFKIILYRRQLHTRKMRKGVGEDKITVEGDKIRGEYKRGRDIQASLMSI